MTLLSHLIIGIYFFTAFLLMLYGLNCYILLFLFQRGSKEAETKRKSVRNRVGDIMLRNDLPAVTTQIPIYNEYNVAERVMRAASQMAYPAGKHEIQVLDDSSDETGLLIDEVARRLRFEGYDIRIIRRKDREGFKAGALAAGLQLAKGELIAVFDADFVPPEDFLEKTVPFLLDNDRLGLVQARWGHLNRNCSLLTRVQSIGIDGHFMIEQSARNWGGLYMNFNGTAGLWKKQAIVDGGGWKWDTLTEDMDLSYRVQLRGWETIFLPDVVVPAEIPEDVGAFKSQQFRWAKGSIQTAIKLLPRLFQSKGSPFKKVEAFFHLTHYLVHPMMLILSLLALPVLVLLEVGIGKSLFIFLATVLGLAMVAPNTLYAVSQWTSYKDWYKRIATLPFLVVVGIGLALSNSRGVMEAILGHESGFVRTPKKGDHALMSYKIRLPWSGIFEILIGLYCAGSFGYYIAAGKYLVGPFLAAYASGFLFIGLLTLVHALGSTK